MKVYKKCGKCVTRKCGKSVAKMIAICKSSFSMSCKVLKMCAQSVGGSTAGRAAGVGKVCGLENTWKVKKKYGKSLGKV